MNLKDVVIVSDFDGTITLQDSNALLVEVLGDEENIIIESEFVRGLKGSRETFVRHFKNMGISMNEYYNFIKEHIDLDSDFDYFLERVREKEIPLFIVSAGFRQGIKYILGDERVNEEDILANDLIVVDEILVPKFAIENPPCTKKAGACGNCKRISIQNIREKTKKKVIFIGDGITDTCTVDEVDLLFAKDYLEEYCKENRLPYVPFRRFRDVIEYIFGKEGGLC